MLGGSAGVSISSIRFGQPDKGDNSTPKLLFIWSKIFMNNIFSTFPSSVALRTPTHPSKPHSKAHTSMKPFRYRELQPPCLTPHQVQSLRDPDVTPLWTKAPGTITVSASEDPMSGARGLPQTPLHAKPILHTWQCLFATCSRILCVSGVLSQNCRVRWQKS